MSDFTSGFWSVFIIGITLLSIAACGWLLWSQTRVKLPPGVAPTDTTGHVWDGDLQEYNKPLPAWWRNLFWLTLVFSVIYLVLFPGLGTFSGMLGWTQAGQYRAEVDDASAKLAPLYGKFAQLPVEKVAAHPEGRAIGERLFLQHCAGCHGSDAGGARGFPSLRDHDWLYGGDAKAIVTSITEGRTGIMPPQGPALGDAESVKNVVAYVRSLSGMPGDAVRLHLGKEKFAQVCAACHGADAKGMTALGAPNLTDDIWLVGSSEAAITETIVKGRNLTLSPGTSAMPAFKDLLSPEQIHLVAAYVFSLSHPQGKP